jgi:hypothetical protein
MVHALRSRFMRYALIAVSVSVAAIVSAVGTAGAVTSPSHPISDLAGQAAKSASTSSTAWVCYTEAWTPTQILGSGVGSQIEFGGYLSCNVTVSAISFHICLQVSADNVHFWDDSRTCGWWSGNPQVGTYSNHQNGWVCIGNNPWYYRAEIYSAKTFPDGTRSISPTHVGSSIKANC